MLSDNTARPDAPRAVVIGGGAGGLASAIRLAAAGVDVTILERHAHLGGKIRTLASDAGPVDAGPTVLTMRHVFDDLFRLAGDRLEDHVTLVRQDVIARHFWPDGSTLDLFDGEDRSAAAIAAFSGADSARAFRAFCARCRTLFDGFDAPVMQAPAPTLAGLSSHVMRNPQLVGPMAPLSTLRGLLHRTFADRRLVQLFGRYATYVGGAPGRSPALLALIWQAEAAGVWVVDGGMHRLAQALGGLATRLGARIETGAHVARIELQGGKAAAVHLACGTRLRADHIVFNGDPRALATGALGDALRHVAPQTRSLPRSHSARVYSFAARPNGPELAHHNVFFAADPDSEFADLAAGRLPRAPSLYICAEDRGGTTPAPDLERFEIIANAPPVPDPAPAEDAKELDQWHRTIIQTMASFGLTFSPTPTADTITTPTRFDDLFPATLGALYGQTPHGLTAAFRRPTALTPIPGLYLAGGGTHPGAGVPMATLSGRHAADAILSDLTSTSAWAPTAMHGGMSTV